MRPNIFLILLSVFSALMFGNEALACSCNPTPNPPCRSYWETPVIFDGLVEEVKEIELPPEGGHFKRLVKFKVGKGYKGTETDKVEIYTGDGAADCGYPFKVGQRYLVYAHGEKNLFATNYCTRTQPIEYAGEDLEFFDNLSSLPPGATIFGSVKKYAFRYGDEEDFGLTKPLFNIPVKITGAKSAALRTDRNGNFKVSGFPAGKYLIQPVLPRKLKLSVHSRNNEYDFFEVSDRGCVEARFYVEFEGEIRGRVLDEAGKGVAGMDVQLVSADYKYKSRDDTAPLLEWNLTDENGNYFFNGIPPGRYLLGIGIGGSADAFGKNGRIFYPNTLDPTKAAVIEVVEGKTLPDFKLPLPEKK